MQDFGRGGVSAHAETLAWHVHIPVHAGCLFRPECYSTCSFGRLLKVLTISGRLKRLQIFLSVAWPRQVLEMKGLVAKPRQL